MSRLRTKLPNPKLYRVFKKYCATASEKSIELYCETLERFLNGLNKEWGILTNPEYILNVIENSDYKLNTKKNLISCRIKYLAGTDTEASIINKYAVKKCQMNDTKTSREIEHGIDKHYLSNFLADLKLNTLRTLQNFDDVKSYQAYICIGLHKDFKLKNDLADIKIYKTNEFKRLDEKPDNVIIINAHDHTASLTVKSKGIENKKIDGKIGWCITKYYKYTNSHSFLFDKNDYELTRNDYTRFINKIFEKTGRKISTTLLNRIK